MDIARVVEPEHKEHTWDDGVVTTPATCTKTGVKTYTCKVCGTTKEEEIPATGHKFGDYEVTKEATCTEDGVKTAKCTHDGCTETKTEPIPKTGHDYETKTVVDKEAWDEKVADHTVYICKGCKGEFDSAEAFESHVAELEEKYNNDYDKIMENHGPVNNSTRVEYKTVHHDAVTHEEHVCKKCGHVKED